MEAAEKLGGNCVPMVCDVGDGRAVDSAFMEFHQRAGRLDVLFNNAGIFPRSVAIDQFTHDEWSEAVSTNLTGMFNCARAAFAAMKQQTPKGGRIINNGSVSSLVPRRHAIGYTATKHGVTGLTKQLALDGRYENIACGQIDIGNAATELLSSINSRGDTSESSFDLEHVVKLVYLIAELPLSCNIPFVTIMATGMPLLGRG